MREITLRRYRVTIERQDGSYYVSDQRAISVETAQQNAMTEYRAKYREPFDGESYWMLKAVEVPEPEAT